MVIKLVFKICVFLFVEYGACVSFFLSVQDIGQLDNGNVELEVERALVCW
jgi:hypothetical protein